MPDGHAYLRRSPIFARHRTSTAPRGRLLLCYIILVCGKGVLYFCSQAFPVDPKLLAILFQSQSSNEHALVCQ